MRKGIILILLILYPSIIFADNFDIYEKNANVLLNTVLEKAKKGEVDSVSSFKAKIHLIQIKCLNKKISYSEYLKKEEEYSRQLFFILNYKK